MRKILLTFLIFILVTESNSQTPDLQWTALYSLDSINDVNEVLIDKNGSIFLTGHSYNSSINFRAPFVRYSSAGELLFNAQFSNSKTKGYGLAEHSSGLIFSSVYDDLYIKAYYFNTAWVTASSTAFVSWDGRKNRSFIQIDNNDYIYIAGSLSSPGSPGMGFTSFTVTKMRPHSPFGIIFSKNYYSHNTPSTEACKVFDFKLDSLGNYYLTGRNRLNSSQQWGFTTIKCDSGGTMLWSDFYNGSAGNMDSAQSLAIDKSLNVIVAGNVTNTITGSDIVIIKYDVDGNIIWERVHDYQNGVDLLQDMSIDDNSNIIITGSRGIGESKDITTIMYDSLGNVIWERVYNGNADKNDMPNEILLDKYNDIYVGGSSIEDTAHGSDFLILKYDINGDLLWKLNYNDTVNNKDDLLKSMKFDKSRGMVLSGTSERASGKVDIITMKYDNVVYVKNNSETITSFHLSQNYPNPFNPSTKIKFDIPKGSLVKLKIYDMLGREVAELVNDKLNPGTYEYEWNGVNLPSGVYFYKLESENFIETKRMVLVK